MSNSIYSPSKEFISSMYMDMPPASWDEMKSELNNIEPISLHPAHKKAISESMIGNSRENNGQWAGKNNGMYGSKRFGVKAANKKKVNINGVIYNTCKQAADDLGVSQGSITYWIKTGKASIDI